MRGGARALVVYLRAPTFPDGDAVVVGNRQGLLALRGSIDRALEQKTASQALSTAEGSGEYVAWVLCLDEPLSSEVWQNVASLFPSLAEPLSP